MRDKGLRDARDEQQELEALHRLDEECVHQQRVGNYLKAFDCMERALVLRRHFFGVESEEVIQACRALAEMCNLLAMSFLQQDNYSVTIELLKKAEVLTQRHHPVERATTLNNFACYYRRLGKLHSAMTSLKHALELEKKMKNVRNAADTQLNMCAVLSQLGKHQEALEHAQDALITLQEGFIHDKRDASVDNSTGDSSSARLDRISVMCIAYHNIGVEQEFLKEYSESVASYKKGIVLAEQYLGADHSITTTIRNSYLAAKRNLATKTKVKPSSGSRGQKPIAGARLLSSPRSGSLRMPSPKAKKKDHHSGFPTPRSIISEALARVPLMTLPPLEVQSPPSVGTTKKNADEVMNAAPTLSPTDPFFSPRFRFDSDMTQPKPKALASITSPQSVASTKVEVRTTPSSNGRRKSSVKKPSSRTDSRRNDKKKSTDERMQTAPTPEEDTNTKAITLTDDAGGEVADSFIGDSSKGNMAEEPNGAVHELASAGRTEELPILIAPENSNLPDVLAQSAPIIDTSENHEIIITERQNVTVDTISSVDQELDPTTHTVCLVESSHEIEESVVGGIDGAISKMTSVVDTVTEVDVQSSPADVTPEEENITVDPPLKKQETTGDLGSDFRGTVKDNGNTESYDSAPNGMDARHDHETPKLKTLEDAADVSDELTAVSNATEKEGRGEQSYQVIEDLSLEDNTEVDVNVTDQGGSSCTKYLAGEDDSNIKEGNPPKSEETLGVEGAQNYVPSAQSAFDTAENVLDVENAGIHDTNEDLNIENHAVDEEGDATTQVDDQPRLSSFGVDDVDIVTPEGNVSTSDIRCNEVIEAAAPVEPLLIENTDVPEEDNGHPLIEEEGQFFDHKANEPQTSNGVESANDHEAQESHPYTDDFLLSEEFHPTIDSYETGGYYDENDISSAVEAQEDAYGGGEQEVNSVEH